MNPVALTIKSNAGVQRVLISSISIVKPGETIEHTIQAIWDTGATGSVIAKSVAKNLNLIPTGISQVSTANGIALQNTYTINIKFPNGLEIVGVVVTEVDGLSGGCDGLIGMDIITLGDFSITNYNGVTCMSFRVPSQHEIDYVKNPHMKGNQNPPTGGSNYTPPKKKRKKR